MKLLDMERFYRGVLEESISLNNVMVQLVRGEEVESPLESIYEIYSDYYCHHKNICDNLAGIFGNDCKSLIRIQDLLLNMSHNLNILKEAITEENKREVDDELIRNLKEMLSERYDVPVECIKVSVGCEESGNTDTVAESNRLDIAPEYLVDFVGDRYRDKLNNLHNHIMQFMPCEEVVKAFNELPTIKVVDLSLKDVRRILHTEEELDFEFLIVAFHIIVNSKYEVSDVNLICKRYRRLVNTLRGY